MAYLFDQKVVRDELKDFFNNEKATINNFGSTVNQTFEAHVFANVIKWYKGKGWTVSIINPIRNGKPVFALKFNTRGAPANYSYAHCTKGSTSCQIRHGLRTHTKFHHENNVRSANIVCDIVIMEDLNINHLGSDDALENQYLLAFGEVKHMSAYAELIANFIGLVHELKPGKLKRIRTSSTKKEPKENISCFLYVSGILYKTAEGLVETIKRRKYDIDIYSFNNPMIETQ